MAHVNHSFATAGVLVILAMAGMVGQQPPAAPPAAPRNYRPVTAERLKTPDAGDWLMVRRTYDGWGYSPLKQITPANVVSPPAGVDVCHRPGERARGAADRE